MKNYKNELTKALITFGAEYRALSEQADAVKANANLSDVGRATQLQYLQGQVAQAGQRVAEQAGELVDSAMMELQNKWEAPMDKLTDAGYQAGLSNAVKMLEAGTVARDDFPVLLGKFEGDYSALGLLKEAAKKSAKYAGVPFPMDNRAHTLGLLEQIKSNLVRLAGVQLPASVQKPWNVFNNGGLINATIEVDSLLEFIDTLTDELEPPAQTVPLFTLEDTRHK